MIYATVAIAITAFLSFAIGYGVGSLYVIRECYREHIEPLNIEYTKYKSYFVPIDCKSLYQGYLFTDKQDRSNVKNE